MRNILLIILMSISLNNYAQPAGNGHNNGNGNGNGNGHDNGNGNGHDNGNGKGHNRHGAPINNYIFLLGMMGIIYGVNKNNFYEKI